MPVDYAISLSRAHVRCWYVSMWRSTGRMLLEESVEHSSEIFNGNHNLDRGYDPVHAC